MHSHQRRMKHYARMIYMLSQCKDMIDNYAALFARITMARIERLGRLTRNSHELKKSEYSRRVNQSGACSSSDVITNSHFAATLVLPGTSPSHDANSRLLCSEFHARMKRVNSKCSSIQQRVNSAIFSIHSHLV